MTAQVNSLARLTGTLAGLGVPHMLTGGLAANVWGEPRPIQGIDVTVWVEEAEIPRVISAFADSRDLRPPPKNPGAFVRETRVLPLQGPENVPIAVVFGLMPLEEDAIRRAVRRTICGVDVPVCPPEDLILHLLVSSGRGLGGAVEGILRRQRDALDFDWLEPRIAELSREIHPDIGPHWTVLTEPYRSVGPPRS